MAKLMFCHGSDLPPKVSILFPFFLKKIETAATAAVTAVVVVYYNLV